MPRQPIGNTKSKNLINEKNLGEEPVVKWTEREKEREREREKPVYSCRCYLPLGRRACIIFTRPRMRAEQKGSQSRKSKVEKQSEEKKRERERERERERKWERYSERMKKGEREKEM